MVTPTPTSAEPQLCLQLGFDAPARQQRLALLELGSADTAILHTVQQEAIRPQCNSIMDAFYDFLLSYAEMRRFLTSHDVIRRLKTTQQEYLHSFGLQPHECNYFEYRLRIGIAHERIGMPLHLYLAAYRKLETLIQDSLPPKIRAQPDLYSQCLHSISKVVMLDMSLAIDTYTRSRVEVMTESLQALSQERDILNNQLMRDTLTGTLSRRFILEALNKQLAQLARQPDRHVCIALMDLDYFKRVNDEYGHLVGDKVLYEFSRVVSSRIREQDYFGRFGGEEFLLVMTEIPMDEAFTVLDRIRDATQQQSFTHEGKRIPLTVSIGFTLAVADEKVDDLIERADSALYQAKRSGRNQVAKL